MRFARTFAPLKPATDQNPPKVIAFDTEDNGEGAPDNFICAAFYTDDERMVFTKREEARKWMLKSRGRSVIFFAHNLAYDLANLDYPEGDVSLIPIQSRLIGGVYKKGTNKARFLDTGNFFVGATIDQLGASLGFPKLDFDVRKLRGKHYDELECGDQVRLGEYCMRDAEICYKTAMKLVRLCMDNNTRFKSFTAPSLAVRIFRTNFLKEKWPVRPAEINRWERLAYYGGRTEVFDYREWKDVFYEDIVSSYPTAMKTKEFPWPGKYTQVRFVNRESRAEHWKELRLKEGVVLAEVEVPFMRIPPLPYRRQEDGKLLFPWGRWTAAYTMPELRMAERYGVKIHPIEALVYHRMFRPFADYIDCMFPKKEAAAKGSIEREFYKHMMNDLSGKFGQRSLFVLRGKAESLRHCECPEKGKRFKCVQCGNFVLENIDFTSAGDSNGWISFHSDTFGRDPTCSFPILIAYITAYGRIKLYEERLARCKAAYCDTDSCVSPDSPCDGIGTTLGNWEQKKIESFKAFCPKVYLHEGKFKMKGVPSRAVKIFHCRFCRRDYESQSECCGSMTMERRMFERPLKLAEAIRRDMKPNAWTVVRKRLRMDDDKRRKLRGGTSEPLNIDMDNVYTGFSDFVRELE